MRKGHGVTAQVGLAICHSTQGKENRNKMSSTDPDKIQAIGA